MRIYKTYNALRIIFLAVFITAPVLLSAERAVTQNEDCGRNKLDSCKTQAG
jgi:hypothetical protein